MCKGCASLPCILKLLLLPDANATHYLHILYYGATDRPKAVHLTDDAIHVQKLDTIKNLWNRIQSNFWAVSEDVVVDDSTVPPQSRVSSLVPSSAPVTNQKNITIETCFQEPQLLPSSLTGIYPPCTHLVLISHWTAKLRVEQWRVAREKCLYNNWLHYQKQTHLS